MYGSFRNSRKVCSIEDASGAAVARHRGPGPADAHRGAEAGQDQHDGAGQDQVLRRPLLGEHARDGRARDRPQHRPQPHQAVDPLGLRDRVELAQHDPELQRGQRAEDPRPHVEGAQGPRAGRGVKGPEDEASPARSSRARRRGRAVRRRAASARDPGRARWPPPPSPGRRRGARRGEGGRGTARRERSRGGCGRPGSRRWSGTPPSPPAVQRA